MEPEEEEGLLLLTAPQSPDAASLINVLRQRRIQRQQAEQSVAVLYAHAKGDLQTMVDHGQELRRQLLIPWQGSLPPLFLQSYGNRVIVRHDDILFDSTMTLAFFDDGSSPSFDRPGLRWWFASHQMMSGSELDVCVTVGRKRHGTREDAMADMRASVAMALRINRPLVDESTINFWSRAHMFPAPLNICALVDDHVGTYRLMTTNDVRQVHAGEEARLPRALHILARRPPPPHSDDDDAKRGAAVYCALARSTFSLLAAMHSSSSSSSLLPSARLPFDAADVRGARSADEAVALMDAFLTDAATPGPLDYGGGGGGINFVDDARMDAFFARHESTWWTTTTTNTRFGIAVLTLQSAQVARPREDTLAAVYWLAACARVLAEHSDSITFLAGVASTHAQLVAEIFFGGQQLRHSALATPSMGNVDEHTYYYKLHGWNNPEERARTEGKRQRGGGGTERPVGASKNHMFSAVVLPRAFADDAEARENAARMWLVEALELLGDRNRPSGAAAAAARRGGDAVVLDWEARALSDVMLGYSSVGARWRRVFHELLSRGGGDKDKEEEEEEGDKAETTVLLQAAGRSAAVDFYHLSARLAKINNNNNARMALALMTLLPDVQSFPDYIVWLRTTLRSLDRNATRRQQTRESLKQHTAQFKPEMLRASALKMKLADFHRVISREFVRHEQAAVLMWRHGGRDDYRPLLDSMLFAGHEMDVVGGGAPVASSSTFYSVFTEETGNDGKLDWFLQNPVLNASALLLADDHDGVLLTGAWRLFNDETNHVIAEMSSVGNDQKMTAKQLLNGMEATMIAPEEKRRRLQFYTENLQPPPHVDRGAFRRLVARTASLSLLEEPRRWLANSTTLLLSGDDDANGRTRTIDPESLMLRLPRSGLFEAMDMFLMHDVVSMRVSAHVIGRPDEINRLFKTPSAYQPRQGGRYMSKSTVRTAMFYMSLNRAPPLVVPNIFEEMPLAVADDADSAWMEPQTVRMSRWSLLLIHLDEAAENWVFAFDLVRADDSISSLFPLNNVFSPARRARDDDRSVPFDQHLDQLRMLTPGHPDGDDDDGRHNLQSSPPPPHSYYEECLFYPAEEGSEPMIDILRQFHMQLPIGKGRSTVYHHYEKEATAAAKYSGALPPITYGVLRVKFRKPGVYYLFTKHAGLGKREKGTNALKYPKPPEKFPFLCVVRIVVF